VSCGVLLEPRLRRGGFREDLGEAAAGRADRERELAVRLEDVQRVELETRREDKTAFRLPTDESGFAARS